MQAIAGAPFPPPTRSVASLADAPKPATLAGVRLLPAGRLGRWIVGLREPAAMAPPVPAVAGAVWDGRFRLARLGALPAERDARRLGCRCVPVAPEPRRCRPPCCGHCPPSGRAQSCSPCPILTIRILRRARAFADIQSAAAGRRRFVPMSSVWGCMKGEDTLCWQNVMLAVHVIIVPAWHCNAMASDRLGPHRVDVSEET